MPIEKIVVNSSPLIVLFKSDLETLLPSLYPTIIVPEAVWAEVSRGTTKEQDKVPAEFSSWPRGED